MMWQMNLPMRLDDAFLVKMRQRSFADGGEFGLGAEVELPREKFTLGDGRIRTTYYL